MPTVNACVAAVQEASGGKLDEREAAELVRDVLQRRKAEEAKGNLDNLDARLRAAAAQAADRAQIAAALRAKHAALSAIAYSRSLDQVRALRAQGLDWKRSVLALLEGTVRNVEGGRASVAATAMGYQGRFMEPVNRILVTDAEVARRLREPGFADAVVREMRELRPDGAPGITKDPAALRLAKAYEQAAELARLDLNRHGAPIGKLDGWSPQAHAAERVVKVSPEEWAAFILPRLDRERTFPGMADDLVAVTLRDTYTRITTGQDRNPGGAELSGRVGPANLANSLAASRVLHFRDADAWLSYAARFGAGDIHAAMAAHLQSAAKYAAQLERFGPNPEATFTRLLGTLQREAATDPALTPKQRAEASRALAPGAPLSSIGSAWAEVSGLTSAPGNLTLAQIGTWTRTVQSLAKLGGAIVSSLSDLGTRATALTYEGRPITAAWGDNLAELAKARGTGQAREIAAILDAGTEGMRSHLVAAGIAEDMPMGAASKLTASFFRWQGLTWWQDAMKAGSARMLSRWMGLNADKPLAALPESYRRVLRQQGIGAAEWDAIRATAWTAEDGARYVTPDRLAAVPRGTLAKLARAELDALDKGLADRVARRQQADATEAEWVKKRTDALAAGMQRAVARLQKVNAEAREAGAENVAALRERMGELEGRLSDLAEFHSAVAEGRAWTPAAEAAAPEALPAPARRRTLTDWRTFLDTVPDLAAAEKELARAGKAELQDVARAYGIDPGTDSGPLLRAKLTARAVGDRLDGASAGAAIERRRQQAADAAERDARIAAEPERVRQDFASRRGAERLSDISPIRSIDPRVTELLPNADLWLHEVSSRMLHGERVQVLVTEAVRPHPDAPGATVSADALKETAAGRGVLGIRLYRDYLDQLAALPEPVRQERLMRTLLHETGHLVAFSRFEGLPRADQNAIRLEFARERDAFARTFLAERGEDAGPGVDTTAAYTSIFDEWFAERWRRWITDRRPPQSALERFFASIMDTLRAAATRAAEFVGYRPDPQGLDFLFDRWWTGSREGLPETAPLRQAAAEVSDAELFRPAGSRLTYGMNAAPAEGGQPRSSNTIRSGEAGTETGRVFDARTERYLRQGDPATLAARAEGELRARLDALRRSIGDVNRAMGQAEKGRLQDLVTWWNRQQQDLGDFTTRMEARAKARAEATAAERGQWDARVNRILDAERSRLDLTVRRFFADEMRFAYIETDAASRRVALWNSGAATGTVTGELLRTLMQFKGYPIAFTQRVLGRAALGFGAPGAERTVGDRLMQGAHIGQVLLTTAFLGYISMSLKDILRGNQPRDPTRPKTIMAALQQGGGAGIAGDFLFAEASRFGNPALVTAAGPTASSIDSLISLFNAAKEGDAKAGRALSLALSHTPFLSLWYVRPAMDLLFLNELRESLSPGHLSRIQRERRRDFGQERWAPVSVWR